MTHRELYSGEPESALRQRFDTMTATPVGSQEIHMQYTPTKRSGEFIPPEETGYTLHDLQMEAVSFSGERRGPEMLTREARIAAIEDELDRIFIERKLRELRDHSAFDSTQQSDGYRGAEPVYKNHRAA